MASVGLAKLQQFILEGVEGLDNRREKGRGSYGAVYEVELNGVPCIAKRLHDILVGRGQEQPVSEEDRQAAISRFREECVLLSGLRHPNIVQMLGVHDGGSDEADISLIMEYMHMDLRYCIETYSNVPLPCKTSILRDVTYGLAYLHSRPIIHRDLNAGNVLLTESLKAKIADLGVAKLLDRETAMIRTRTVCPGAHDFMSPESLEDPPKYDVKLDVFSFGHLAIYLVNQRPPHTLDSGVKVKDIQKKQQQVGKRRRALDQMSHQLGSSRHPLYSTVVQCLSDTPDQRPTSRDLVKRMEKVCKQYPIPHENTLQTLAELSKIEELENKLMTKENELMTKNEHIAKLMDLLTTKDEKLAELSGSLITKDHQLSESWTALTVKDQQVAELNGSVRTKDCQLADLKEELNREVRQLHGHSPMALSPTPRALKCTSEPVGELREAHSGQTVVGIDLDMSSCSMSYRISTTNPVESVELAPGRCTIPMVLLLRKLDGDNCMVESIGEKAREANYSLTSLSSAELSKFHYFELNLLLYRHKDVGREMSITSFGEPFYLVEVLAFILKHLKQLLMRQFERKADEAVILANVHWVITVPEELSRLIREAASLACLWSKDEGILKLTQFGNKVPPAVGPTKNITIASRSYCSALRFCTYHMNDMADYSDWCFHKLQGKYLIVDVGKSTVNITALMRSPTDSCYEFVVPTVTHAVGGMQVNQNFSKFLQKLVNDREFSRFLTTKKFFRSVSRNSDHGFLITYMIDHNFEIFKNYFVKKGLEKAHSQKFPVLLEKRFLDFYTNHFFLKQIWTHGDSRITFNSQDATLEIEYSKMAEFYDPVLQDIQHHVVCALDKIPLDNIDAVCFAGEFGGCRYVYEHMMAALSSHRKLRQAIFSVPTSYGVVASQGAAYYWQPTSIITQVMNASYGINASVPFQEDELVEENMVFYSTGRVWHQNVFLPFVYQGEKVKTTDVFTVSDLLPPQQSQTEITFHVYRSTNPKVRYTTDEDTEKIGELSLVLPNPNNIPNSERKLKVSMNFSSTEIIIHAQALYLPDQPTVTIVL